MAKVSYKRIMLKLSGEILEGGGHGGIDKDAIFSFCKEIASHAKKGMQVVVVIGGGNFWRHRDHSGLGLDRVVSDNIGMLATVMNAIAMHSVLDSMDCKNIAMSAIPMAKIIDDYTPRLAEKALECGWVVICAGGTGNPFFSTDSAAALRGLELSCDVLLKATNVDYVYDKDPKKFKDAKKFDKISYSEVLERGLGVMDLTAISLCKDGGLPIQLFNMQNSGNLTKVLGGKTVGTLISSER